jgi:hypothetical protein
MNSRLVEDERDIAVQPIDAPTRPQQGAFHAIQDPMARLRAKVVGAVLVVAAAAGKAVAADRVAGWAAE